LRPTANIDRSVAISVGRETTANAQESLLIRTVTTINTTADLTGFGRVARVNQNHRHTGQTRLVFNLLAQIVKRPSVMLSPLAFSNRYSLTDALQIFKGYSHRVPFGLFNNLLGNFVVFVGRHSLLFAAAFFEQATGRFSTLALQLGSEFGVTLAKAIKVISGVGLAGAIGQDVFDTQVAPKIFRGLEGRILCHFTRGKEVEVTVNQHQITFALLGHKLGALAFPTNEGI
jgi:hypothetical protein